VDAWDVGVSDDDGSGAVEAPELVAPGGEESDDAPECGADEAEDDGQAGALEDALFDPDADPLEPDRGAVDFVCAGVDAPPWRGDGAPEAGGPGFTGGSRGVVRGSFGGFGPTGTTSPTPAA
jgi:hypothetical protein